MVIKDSRLHIPQIDIDFERWKREKRPMFFPNFADSQKALKEILTENEKTQIIERAEKASKGIIRCFSKWEGDYGCPINWHINPRVKKQWPRDIHWSKVLRNVSDCGDIKLAWEINRFPHIYDMVRGFLITECPTLFHAIFKQLKDWGHANPYGKGINWQSGQELSVRLMAWIYVIYMLSDHSEFKSAYFDYFIQLVYSHSYKINKDLDFVKYAVDNNHLISEALGLYLSGTLFPYFKESPKWKNTGKSLLDDKKCLGQFYNDGGYCQFSHTYHRVALHYYLWYVQTARCNQELYPDIINIHFEKSFNFLYTQLLRKSGELPNWGSNDGALVNPWTVCDYGDFRPLLQTLGYIVNQSFTFASGPWDEEVLWFTGLDSLHAPHYPLPQNSQSFKVMGLHTLRKTPGTFATFRCGTVSISAGHADQLHVDIFWKGQNLALDGGSYLYNDEPSFHHYFMGTRSHNTVSVNQSNQMFHFRKFKWLYLTKAKLLQFAPDYVIGEHYGYNKSKSKVIHRRKVSFNKENQIEIYDQLIAKTSFENTYDLQWLMVDAPYTIKTQNEKKVTLLFTLETGPCLLSIEGTDAFTFNIEKGAVKSDGPYGWTSRYYGEKVPSLSITARILGSYGCEFVTTFREAAI